MRLVNVYREPTAVDVLYQLLRERPAESRISHRKMPTREEHRRFVRSKPYRHWYLIRAEEESSEGAHVHRWFVGDIHATHLNEIGVFIFKRWRGYGFGAEALQLFMQKHKPLGAITAKRVARWLANVSIRNEPAKQFFAKMGFERVQETWGL